MVDGKVELFEAVILFVLYLGYCTIMWFNRPLEAWAKGTKKGKGTVGYEVRGLIISCAALTL